MTPWNSRCKTRRILIFRRRRRARRHTLRRARVTFKRVGLFLNRRPYYGAERPWWDLITQINAAEESGHGVIPSATEGYVGSTERGRASREELIRNEWFMRPRSLPPLARENTKNLNSRRDGWTAEAAALDRRSPWQLARSLTRFLHRRRRYEVNNPAADASVSRMRHTRRQKRCSFRHARTRARLIARE